MTKLEAIRIIGRAERVGDVDSATIESAIRWLSEHRMRLEEQRMLRHQPWLATPICKAEQS